MSDSPKAAKSLVTQLLHPTVSISPAWSWTIERRHLLLSLLFAVGFCAGSLPATASCGANGDDAEFTSITVPRVVSVGESFQVQVEVRNVGNTSWVYNGPGSPCDENYKLAVLDSLPGSPFEPWVQSPWSPWRVFPPNPWSVPNCNSDAVNCSWTFQFTLTAPSTAGRHPLIFQMIKGGQIQGATPFGTPSDTQIVFVDDPVAPQPPSGADAEIISVTVPGVMVAGDPNPYKVRVKMRNNGSITWTDCDKYKLGIDDPPSGNIWGNSWVHPIQTLNSCNAILNGQIPPKNSVGPESEPRPNDGKEASVVFFEFDLMAPATPGRYPFSPRMFKGGIAAGIHYFGEAPATRTIEVVSQRSSLPNIVNIVLDDLDYCDLSRFTEAPGHPIASPKIDQLIDEGMKFTNYYSNGAVCSPTRSSLLTGRYPTEFGVKRSITTRGVPGNSSSLAELLKKKGYTTGHFGKWHIGEQREKYRPTSHGFDESLVFYAGVENYWCYDLFEDDQRREIHNLNTETQYLDDRITDRAVEFITKHSASEPSRPYYLDVWYFTPHQANDIYSRPSVQPQKCSCCTAGQPGCVNPDPQCPSNKYSIYVEQVEHIDQKIQEVLDAIPPAQRGNTIVLLSSDNGGTYPGDGSSPCSPIAYKGKKAEVLERGIKVPLIIRWPDRVTPGTVNPSLALSMDLLPTLADIVGLDVSTLNLPGETLLTTLESSDPASDVLDRSTEFFYWEGSNGKFFAPPGAEASELDILNNYAVRQGDLKLVRQYNQNNRSRFLYDLENHPGETGDLLNGNPNHPDAQTLENQYFNWRRSVGRIDFQVESIEGVNTVFTGNTAENQLILPDPSSRVSLEHAPEFDIGKGAFTFLAQVKLTGDPLSLGVQSHPIIAQQKYAWTLFMNLNTYRVHLKIEDRDGEFVHLLSDTPLEIGEEVEVAFTVYGFPGSSSGQESIVSLYVNGERQTNRCLRKGVRLSDSPISLGNNLAKNRGFVGEMNDIQFFRLRLYEDQIPASPFNHITGSEAEVSCCYAPGLTGCVPDP